MKRTWWRLGASLGLMLAAGCGDGGGASPATTGAAGVPGAGGRPKFLFVTNGNSDWWNAVEKGMQDGAEAFGCEAVMRRNGGDTQGQVEKLRDALAQPDVAGVAVSVVQADAPGVLDAMRALRKAEKVVIVVDSDVAADAQDARVAYIGTDNSKAGEAAGRAAATLRPQGGKTALFVGYSSAANAREREEGFFKGAGPKFARVETWEDQNDMSRAASNVKSSISKTPDLGVLVGLWSYNAPYIASEMRSNPSARKQATVVTFDLDEKAVADIAEGFIDVSICQNPYEMGYQGVKLLKGPVGKDEKAIKEVLPDGKARDTGVRVIVPRGDSPVVKEGKAKGDDVITVDEMKSWLASKGLKSS